MISITLEGGDGIKNPKLFYKDPHFNAEKVPRTSWISNYYVDLDGTIASTSSNSSTHVNSLLTNHDLSILNNIEIKITFFTQNQSPYLLQTKNSYTPRIQCDGGTQVGLYKDSNYASYLSYNMKPYMNDWLTLVVHTNKTTDTLQLFKDDVLLAETTKSSPRWFLNNQDPIYFGFWESQSVKKLDLSKTWIKDLDTNEILVPWFD